MLVLDQASKAWVIGNLDVGEGIELIGDWLRVVHWRNSGALFGLLPQSAPIFAVVSLGVVALIVVYHRRAGRGYLTTVALALLLGGAIGNLLDRLRYGSVVDFVDMGIGQWRFYTYNAADAAITTADPAADRNGDRAAPGGVGRRWCRRWLTIPPRGRRRTPTRSTLTT